VPAGTVAYAAVTGAPRSRSATARDDFRWFGSGAFDGSSLPAAPTTLTIEPARSPGTSSSTTRISLPRNASAFLTGNSVSPFGDAVDGWRTRV
jgi:hypothetical protein